MYQLKLGEKILYNKIKRANKTIDRMIGLMFAPSLEGSDALWITPCNQIHTFFMRFSLDVVFLTKDLKVVKVLKSVKPYRLTWLYFKAFSVLEFEEGTLTNEIQEGQQLELVCIS